MTEIIDVSPLAKRRNMAAVARITAMVMGLLLVLPVYADLPNRVYGLPLAGVLALAVIGGFVYLGSAAARGHRLASGILATMLALFFVSAPLIIILDSSPPDGNAGKANVIGVLIMLVFVLSILAYPLLALLTITLGKRINVGTSFGVALGDVEFMRRKWLQFWRGTFNLRRIGLAVLAICVLVGLYTWIMDASWWRGVVVGLILVGIIWVFDGVLLHGMLYFLTLDYFTKRPEEILEKDRRPIVLYLRSFGDETVQIKRSFLGDSVPFSFENLMVRAMWETGPVVSVGDPMDMKPMFGAARVYLADDEWQEHVADWIDQARLIVVLVGKTAGLEWEYRQIGALQQTHKVLFLFPPLSKNEIKTRWLQLRSVAETAMGLNLPPEIEFKKLMGLVVDPAGNTALITAKKRSYGAYEVMFTFAAKLVKAQRGDQPAFASRKDQASLQRSVSKPGPEPLPPPVPKVGRVEPKQQNALRRAWDYMRGKPELEELAARRREQWLHARRAGSRWEKFIHFYVRDRRNRHLYLIYNLKATIFLLVLLSLCICPTILAALLDSPAP